MIYVKKSTLRHKCCSCKCEIGAYMEHLYVEEDSGDYPYKDYYCPECADKYLKDEIDRYNKKIEQHDRLLKKIQVSRGLWRKAEWESRNGT